MGKRLAKGVVAITRNEFLNAYGLPEEVEILGLKDMKDGTIQIEVISADEVIVEGRRATHEITDDNPGTFRRLRLYNRFRPIGEHEDGTIVLYNPFTDKKTTYKPVIE